MDGFERCSKHANNIYVDRDEEVIALAKKRATSLARTWGEYGNLGFVYVTVSSRKEARNEIGADDGVIWRDGTSSLLSD